MSRKRAQKSGPAGSWGCVNAGIMWLRGLLIKPGLYSFGPIFFLALPAATLLLFSAVLHLI